MSMSREVLLRLVSISLMSLFLIGASAVGQEKTDESIAQLNAEMMKLYQAGKYTEALVAAQRILKIRESELGLEHSDVATSLNNLASLYQATGDNVQAEPLYQRSLAIMEKNLGPKHADLAMVLNGLALLYYNRGDYGRAEPLFRRGLAINEQALGSNHPDLVEWLRILGNLYRVTGDYVQAEPLYLRALALREKALGPEHPKVASSLNNLAMVYHHTGDYKQAELLYRRALAIRENALGSNHLDVAESLNNLGELYRAQGDYAQAVPLIRGALEIVEKALGPEHPTVARALNNLALLHFHINDYKQAEPLFRRSLAIDEKALGSEHFQVATSLNNLGELYRAQGDYAQAESLYHRTLAIVEKALGPQHPKVATSLNNLALVYWDTGNYTQAEPLYRRSLAIQEEVLGPEHPDVGRILHNLAVLLYDSRGDYAQAESLLRRSLAIFEQALGPEHPMVATALSTLAFLVAYQKQYPIALDLFQRRLRIQSRQLHNIFSFTTERQKLAFLHTNSGGYEAYLSLIHQQFSKDPQVVNQGLALVLQRKGVVLDAQSRIRTVMKGRLSEAARKNWERLSALQRRQSQLVLKRPKDLTPEEYRQQLDALQAEIQTIEQTLASESALVAKDLKQRTVTVDATAKALPKGAVLVEFAKIQDYDFTKGQWKPTFRYLAFVLNEKGIVTLVDLGEAEALEAQVARALAAIRESQSTLRQVLIQRSLEALTTLSDRIWAPLAATLGDATQLLLSPDGQLNLVPFGALRDANGRFLVEQFQITYLSSGRDLIGVGEGATTPKSELLLVANPTYGATLSLGNQTETAVRSADVSLNFSALPGTEQEARTIPPLVPDSTPDGILVGKAAREHAVQSARSPRILHLATHGFFLADQPLAVKGGQRGLIRGHTKFESEALVPQNYENPLIRSGLAFAGANHATEHKTGEDGLLTALEITGMDLSGTELVVLSACETALGEVQTGEGVFGLRRAFSLAGAQNLLMSLWSVNDAVTAQQMRTFYTNLQTQSPAQALQAAQRATIKELRTVFDGVAPPALWAPFILQGAPVPVN